MTRYKALQILLHLLEDDHLALFTTGMTSREAFSIRDRKSNFYMVGSMGLLSSVGLGISLSRTNKKVIVFDGDGSLLMSLGSMSLVGYLQPKNFYHIVLDNEVYASTGGQPTVSKAIKLEQIAQVANYRRVYKSMSSMELKPIFKEMLEKEGPSFLLIKIDRSNEKRIGRVSYSPEEIKDQFMKALNMEKS